MVKTTERLKVRLYTFAHILDGYISTLPEERLLDILNGILTGELRALEEFLQINEAELCSSDEKKEILQSVYINKTNIIFAREIEDDQMKKLDNMGGSSGKVRHIPYPFVSKWRIPVRLYMPFYTLTGQMHCAEGQPLSDLLNTGERFLPLTNVEILSWGGSSESVSFAVINKEQIISLEDR